MSKSAAINVWKYDWKICYVMLWYVMLCYAMLGYVGVMADVIWCNINWTSSLPSQDKLLSILSLLQTKYSWYCVERALTWVTSLKELVLSLPCTFVVHWNFLLISGEWLDLTNCEQEERVRDKLDRQKKTGLGEIQWRLTHFWSQPQVAIWGTALASFLSFRGCCLVYFINKVSDVFYSL